jgi:hypothetical protein
MKKRSYAFAFFVLLSTILHAQQHQLVKKWETDSSLKVPESVLYDAKSKVLYVSNIDGDAAGKDGKGSIGKVGLDGKIIAVDWVSGLNAPKGMGIYKNNLYVADLDAVVVIDIKKGTITKRIPIQGAVFLNDVSISKKGVVYVSDSRASKVHKIENGVASVFLENLKGPNGVLVQGEDVYVLNSGEVLKADKNGQIQKVAEGLQSSTDGIEQVKGKDFIVSCWSGVIYYVKQDGTKEQLLDTRGQNINSADIGYDAKRRIVYVPTFFKNSVVAYELKDL